VTPLAAWCTEPESGGRMLDAILTNTLLPVLSRELLASMTDGMSTHIASIGVSSSTVAYPVT
jgi:type VI secretion system protein VasG